MDPMNDPQNQRLLSDEDFVRLMEAEHARMQTPGPTLEQEQIWQGLRSKIRKSRKPWLPALLAAAIVGMVALPFLGLEKGSDETRIKGDTEDVRLTLDILVLDADQTLKNLQAPVLGQNLVFRFSSMTDVQLGLVLQKDKGTPEILYRTREPLRGQDQLLGQAGQVYVYELDAAGHALRFCLIAAKDSAQLDERLKNIRPEDWQKRGEACQTFDML